MNEKRGGFPKVNEPAPSRGVPGVGRPGVADPRRGGRVLHILEVKAHSLGQQHCALLLRGTSVVHPLFYLSPGCDDPAQP